MRRLPALGAIVAMLCLVAVPGLAQTGNASDVTGVNITSSGITGGVFTPAPHTAVNPNASTALVTSAVEAAATSVRSSLESGNITGGGIGISGAGVSAVGVLMASAQSPAAVLAQVSTALSTSGAGAGTVNALASGLTGLLAKPTPAAVTGAVSAFNAFVAQASASFLAHPPTEFQAIYAALSSIVSSGNAAAGS